jgi:tRNA-splicing ligase RtcB (3'-phosphate/5'-hydroxy nucleic acid ligase)
MAASGESIKKSLEKISDYAFQIPPSFRRDMLVPARIYVSEAMLEDVLADKAIEQLINVATLPGIQKYALAMPDIHEGYGFPIGGVAAMAIDEGGVISPGGIGYDINCGVRLLACDLLIDDARPHLESLAREIFHQVPSGVGRSGHINLSRKELDIILEHGATAMVNKGMGNDNDLVYCESLGQMKDADANLVSDRAKDRGHDQLGTLGSGNHFLEVQVVDEIYHPKTAEVFGLRKGQVTAMIHCGSRGLGHQVCTDYVKNMLNVQAKYQIKLVDRQLAYVPFLSVEGQNYFAAMKASANFAWANRHMIGHHIRASFIKIFGKESNVRTIYDVAHNIGKLETHQINGQAKKLLVHRKGATRAFGPKESDLASKYLPTGQPVLIPGTMGTASYVLTGTSEAMKESFGSACHGAGRAMSRRQAKMQQSGAQVRQALLDQGIVVLSDSRGGLSEEAPYAYKDIDNVVDAIVGANIAKKIARLRPIAVIKGD